MDKGCTGHTHHILVYYVCFAVTKRIVIRFEYRSRHSHINTSTAVYEHNLLQLMKLVGYNLLYLLPVWMDEIGDKWQ